MGMYVDPGNESFRSDIEPAMIVELKWNKDANTAIDQIHEKNYVGKLADYGGDILIVGINYDRDEKEYSCKIEYVIFKRS